MYEMKTKIFTWRNIIWVLAAVLILGSGIFYLNHKSLNRKLDHEKIKTEALLSKNLDLEKSLEVLKKEMGTLKGKNEKLDQKLKEISDELSTREAQVKKLASANTTLEEVKRKNLALEELRNELEKKVAGLHEEMDRLATEKEGYLEQLDEIQDENKKLAMQVAFLETMLADNYRIEALKGKSEKLTVVARRANKLMVSFDLPPNAGDQIYFKLTTPDGREISSQKDRFATITRADQDENLMASLESSAGVIGGSTGRIELAYSPDYKLLKGIYQFNVFNGPDHMGKLQLRLK